MDAELDFTTPPKVRRTDPETSRRAWAHIKNKVGTQRWRILCAFDLFTDHGDNGLTQDELTEITGVRLNSVSTRVSELIREGYLRVDGERNGQRVVRRVR